MIGWLNKMSVQTFQPLILIHLRGNFVYHHLECSWIYRLLSYPFRSLFKTPQFTPLKMKKLTHPCIQVIFCIWYTYINWSHLYCVIKLLEILLKGPDKVQCSRQQYYSIFFNELSLETFICPSEYLGGNMIFKFKISGRL